MKLMDITKDDTTFSFQENNIINLFYIKKIQNKTKNIKFLFIFFCCIYHFLQPFTTARIFFLFIFLSLHQLTPKKYL